MTSPLTHLPPALFREALTAAAAAWGTVPGDVMRGTHFRTAVRARHTAMLLCREFAEPGVSPSLHSLGRAFGRDHSTVVYGLRVAAAFTGADLARLEAARRAMRSRRVLQAGEGRVEIRIGDCLTRLRELPDRSVDCIVTSPPYWGLRDYGVGGMIGLEASIEAHLDVMVAVFREAHRVLADHGTLWMNYGDAYASSVNGRAAADVEGDDRTFRDKPIDTAKASGLPAKNLLMLPARVALALQEAGWILRSEIIWAKPNPMPESARDRPASSHEKIYLFAKRGRYFYDAQAVREKGEGFGRSERFRGDVYTAGRSHANGDDRDGDRGGGRSLGGETRNCRNVWTIATQAYSGAHFATFPTKLAERCIKAGTSERGCCSKCGAPWVREVAREFRPQADCSPEAGRRAAAGLDTSSHRAGSKRGASVTKTIGWAPTCGCKAARRPALVLDMFGGAGTTGLVAARHGRRALLIELNPDYALGAQKRIDDDWKGPDERAGFRAPQDDEPPPLFAAAGLA